MSAKKKAERAKPSRSDAPICSPLGIDSDSISGSCDCLTKSHNPLVHRHGCKYRLICERDEARTQRDKARRAAKLLRDSYEPGEKFSWENAGAVAPPPQMPDSKRDVPGG